MITLIFDTETTGLPNKNLPPDHPEQARIMQIAMLLVRNGHPIGSFYSVLHPDSWPPTHPKALEAHGLTNELCQEIGIDQAAALSMFRQFEDIANNVVAFNAKFDMQLLNIERSLLGMVGTAKPIYCPMEILTPIMGLRRANGAPKWPNLKEAFEYCYPGQVLEDAHDALGDVKSTAKVWQYLVENKLVQL